jgi:hypothetical protein
MTGVQTLFTNDDADVAERSRRRWVVNAAGSGFFAVMALGTTLHDVPLAVLFLLSGIAQALLGLKVAPARLVLPSVIGACAAVGVVEMRSGRTGIGWICCAWAMVIATASVFALMRRRRQPNGAPGLE